MKMEEFCPLSYRRGEGCFIIYLFLLFQKERIDADYKLRFRYAIFARFLSLYSILSTTSPLTFATKQPKASAVEAIYGYFVECEKPFKPWRARAIGALVAKCSFFRLSEIIERFFHVWYSFV